RRPARHRLAVQRRPSTGRPGCLSVRDAAHLVGVSPVRAVDHPRAAPALRPGLSSLCRQPPANLRGLRPSPTGAGPTVADAPDRTTTVSQRRGALCTQGGTMSELPVSGSYRPTIMGTHGVVASGHYFASLAAQRILDRGGNAVDAGVAAGLCTCVLQ